ncbi:1-phosphofructokinase family hexose kinase [Thermoanaerobacterium thermosaccharolyticum]|uniref:Tagatose-6-phosphate kinase n=1 Tax=Thermoanaerobacterium thermosaccharolyticum M0795 TaxID=698948 RepID=L0IMB2_THETR|nr:1-phosphofructokinase family hexose kinase [Thermoanaerobacterium thermosaccharolyticum]AGB19356.1 6-phosphofructokinase [Thermoanaerobacterium thermosaccharolyticum M0795]
MTLTVTLNPCIDKTIEVEKYEIDKINHVNNVEYEAGGKGINVSRVLHNLGVDVTALCLIGGKTGNEIENLMDRDNIQYHSVKIKEPNRVVTTIREVTNNKQTVFMEKGPNIDESEINKLILEYRILLKKSDIVILSGAYANETMNGIYPKLIDEANYLGLKVILDSHGIGLTESINKKLFLIKPNIDELSEIIGKQIKEDDDIKKTLETFPKKNIENIVVSMGKSGAVFKNKEIMLKGYPPNINEINPVGSGDSFVAGLVYGIVNGFTWIDSLKYAISAGAANAAMWTAANCNKTQIEKLFSKVKISCY